MADKRKDKKVCILGSGNVGSALAKIISENCSKLAGLQEEVTMYVYEETIDGRKLTDIINETRENVKYLPGRSLGSVVAVADLASAAKDADIIVFAFPHRQINTVCAALLGKIKHSALGVVMVKGINLTESNTLELPSRVIGNFLKIQTCVLTGFTFPGEVVAGKLCETTLACRAKYIPLLADVIQTETLHVITTEDVDTVEIFNTLRTLVGCAAGIADGLGQGYNCKGAVFRMGLIEMVKFLDMYYPNQKLSGVFESCCVADLLLSCFYGRDRRVSEAVVKKGMTLGEAEQELLNGLRLEGARVAKDVHYFLRRREVDEFFPLFTAVHKVFAGELRAEEFLTCIRSHPEHNLRLQRITW